MVLLFWAGPLVQGEVFGGNALANYQVPTTTVDSLHFTQATAPAAAPDTLPPTDSLALLLDSLPTSRYSGSTRDYTASSDSLTAPVDYSANDSMWVDFETKEIHLYGDASVKYQAIDLKANHIVLNYGTNIVNAGPLPDSIGQPAGFPEFSDGGQSFVAKEMRYNFKTRKGIVYSTTTTQDDIFIRGGKSKFVSGAVAVNDSTQADVIYTQGAIFTTCSAEHPHFGIRTRKAKVIPNKLAVIGPSNLEIMGVPTPLWLPFGFFPLKSGRSSGLLFPSDYQYSPTLGGYGLEGIGWFFPIGEHVNLSLTADYYLKGTYRLRSDVRYVRRYKYSGSFNFSYNNQRVEATTEIVPTRQKGMSLNWSHRQDQRAHPTFSFGGSINFQTNLSDQRFENDFQTASTNTIRSSMNINKTFTKLKSTLTAGLNHSQNNQTREIRVNFPDAAFTTQTIYPLRELPGRQSAWWKKLSMRYKSQLRTEFVGQDSSFFTQATFDEGQYGFKHDVTSAVSLNVLKYFNLSPNISYGEVYYGKSRAFSLDGDIVLDTIIDPFTGETSIDTLSVGEIIDELNPGLASFRTFNAGVSLSTQIFGKVKFKRKGILGLQGLRHVMKPSINLGYSPDYRNGSDYLTGTPYFITDAEIDPRFGDPDQLNSPFENQIFGQPSSSEQAMRIGYSISNLFEAKVWNRKDTISENVKLFQNIGVSGSYDFTQDSLKWSTISVRGSTQFFKGVTRVNMSAVFDPYITQYNPEKGNYRRVDISNLSQGRLPSMTSFTSSISTNITVAKIRELFQGAEEEYVTDVQEERRQRREEENTLFEETDLLSLFEKFSIRHTFNFRFQREFDTENPSTEDRGTPVFEQIANSLELRGALNLTNNWSVNIGQIGYDFTSKRITYPYLSFVRDLHCWEMRFSWAPQRNFYSFSIAVKPGTLDFINLPVNQNRFDGGRLF